MRRSSLIAIPVLLFATAATAETTIILDKARPQPLSPRVEPVRMQVQLNFFVPGRVDLSEEGAKAHENARRVVYEIASRECAILRDVIASECQLDSVNVSVNVNNRMMAQQTIEGLTISANLGFRIVPK
jgi:hypothetical protein